jgi:hypothetical protein
MTSELTPIPAAFRDRFPANPDISLSDVRPLVRSELMTAQRRLTTAARRGDAVTRAHYADLAARIDRVLNPKE